MNTTLRARIRLFFRHGKTRSQPINSTKWATSSRKSNVSNSARTALKTSWRKSRISNSRSELPTLRDSPRLLRRRREAIMSADIDATPSKERRSFLEVFWVFLRLGVTSFGGPIAHLAYFRAEFVERREWLDEAGPAS